MTDWLTVNAALRPDYVRNKESPMFLRKISLKFCVNIVKNRSQISNKNRNGLWPMQYVFLIRSRAGCMKYVTRLRLVTYFLPPALERIKNTYCMGQRPFLYFYPSVI